MKKPAKKTVKKVAKAANKKTTIQNAIKLLISIGICLFAGLAGSIFTTKEVPVWYANLVKPSFSPPNWLFAPVWTTLFILMGIAFYFIWKSSKDNRLALYGAALFLVHLFFNTLWSIVFFGLHSPITGLIVICILWSMIVAMIFMFYPVKRSAAYLLIPYLLWVSFATMLNYTIVILN